MQTQCPLVLACYKNVPIDQNNGGSGIGILKSLLYQVDR
jgi:hypothetical protein